MCIRDRATIGWVRRGMPGNDAMLFGGGWTGRSGGTLGVRWEPWRDVSIDLSGSLVAQDDGYGRESLRSIAGLGWEADW